MGECKFLQIVDALRYPNQKVNICGFAVETSIPKTTKGTDEFCMVKIIDESHPTGIPVHFFTETMKTLPLMKSVGDIVFLSRVKIQLMRTEDDDYVYACFNKAYSAFALFEGRGSNDLIPYAVSSNYRPTDKSIKFINRLKNWSYGDKIKGLHESVSLHEIKDGEYFNLLCKILRIEKVPLPESASTYEWIIFIWDGTDTPPVSIAAQLDDEDKNPLLLALEPSSLLSRDDLSTFPIVGTVLRMIVDEGDFKLGIDLLKANRWVKFIGIQCETRAALWRAVFTPTSKFYYLPDDDNIAKQCERNYMERVASKWGRIPFTSNPRPSNITVIGCPDLAPVTLMTVLTKPKVPHKFFCVVRVVALLPWRPEDFCSANGIYGMRLTLEDPTARIHAYLSGADWDTFFGNCRSIDVLTKKRNMLLGVDPASTTRNPPWIKCCLKSYYIHGHDQLGIKSYGICETTCVG